MNIERQIEFDKIKEKWAEFALTDWAKERIREATLYFNEAELLKQLKDTTDARVLIEKLGTPPLQNMTELKEALLIAEKGECLTPYQLERVEKFLVAITEGLRSIWPEGRSFKIIWHTMMKIWMSFQNCTRRFLLKSGMEKWMIMHQRSWNRYAGK